MRRKLLLVLVILNCLLGVAVLARVADSQVLPRGIRDCCEGTGPEAYCCYDCCWFVQNCRSHEDCTMSRPAKIPWAVP
jgi:hypothetical protein